MVNAQTPKPMPSVDQMASQLGHQGLTPPAITPAIPPMPEPAPAITHQATHHTSHHWLNMYLQRPVHNTIAVGLTLQGLFGIYKSVSFILVDYKVMETQLAAKIITQADANGIAGKAIMILISTVLSMFFALKLTVLRSRVAKGFHTIIGLLLFLGNALIFDFLTGLPLIDQWGVLVNQVLTGLKNFITQYRSS